MTTIAASLLTESLQALVDARLDTIDRMLLGRVNRQDRLAIVREVESQVFDLLQRHDGGPLDRDDVLAVLARLDPPEAYLTDENSPAPARGPGIRPSTAARVEPPKSRLALAGGVLGIISAVFVVVAYSLAILTEREIEWEIIAFSFALGLGVLASLLAIVFASIVRLRGPWAMAGLVTGIASMSAFLSLVVFLLVNA